MISWYKKTIRALFFYPIFYFIAVYINFKKPTFRIGILRTSRIGHLVGDVDLALTPLMFASSGGSKLKIYFVTENIICNSYALQLIQRIKSKKFDLEIKTSFFLREYCYYVQENSTFNRQFFETRWLGKETSKVIQQPSIFQVTNEERKVFDSWVNNNDFIDSSKPFIYLHNRDSSYLPQLFYHSYRDFSPKVFETIIESYKENYNFFRGGKKAFEPLDSNLKTNLIDLPFMQHSDLIDFLAQDKSVFYFGSESGINSISTIFRKPLAIVNHLSTNYNHIRRLNHLELGFIPKKIFSRNSNRFVGLIEMYENNWRDFWSTRHYEDAGLELKENTEEEILNFFNESLNLFEEKTQKDQVLTPEQEEFWKIITFYEPDSFGEKLILDNCFIGTSYLKNNLYLIEN